MPHVLVQAGETLAREVLRAHGATAEIAADVAEHLMLAERSGHASHGLSILPSYLQAVAAGTLDPTATPQCVRDEPSLLAFDGGRAYGQHAGKVAVGAAIERASNSTSCLLTLQNSYHLGRAGHYGEMAAKAGLIYLSFINVVGREPTVAPFGGAQARLSTNPLCFSAPLADGRAPFLLDYATSGIAANKVRLLAANGKPVEPGLLINSEGQPTVDAAALFAQPPGALLPFGGHKGYALGFMAELLAGVLSGGGTIAPKNARDGGLRNNLFAVLINPAAFGDVTWQQAEASAFADYVTACPPAAGETVRVPGEPEAAAQAHNRPSVFMSAAAWEIFASCARAAGLAPESCVSSE